MVKWALAAPTIIYLIDKNPSRVASPRHRPVARGQGGARTGRGPSRMDPPPRMDARASQAAHSSSLKALAVGRAQVGGGLEFPGLTTNGAALLGLRAHPLCYALQVEGMAALPPNHRGVVAGEARVGRAAVERYPADPAQVVACVPRPRRHPPPTPHLPPPRRVSPPPPPPPPQLPALRKARGWSHDSEGTRQGRGHEGGAAGSGGSAGNGGVGGWGGARPPAASRAPRPSPPVYLPPHPRAPCDPSVCPAHSKKKKTAACLSSRRLDLRGLSSRSAPVSPSRLSRRMRTGEKRPGGDGELPVSARRGTPPSTLRRRS